MQANTPSSQKVNGRGAHYQSSIVKTFPLVSLAELPLFRLSKKGQFSELSLESFSLFEQLQPLSCLPFLIGELAGGRVQKVMVVRNGGRLVVQCIVGCRPKKVG